MRKKAIFISYSWEEDEHQAWVKKFSDDLQARLGDDYEVLLDQNLPRGFSLTLFMETGLEDSERVLIIGTPTYKKKSRFGKGVAFEHTIISCEILNGIDTTKFYPILRKGSFVDSFPLALRGRIGDDFTDDTCYEKNLQTVVNAIIKDNPIPDIFKQDSTAATPVIVIEQQKEKNQIVKETSAEVAKQSIASLDGVKFSEDRTTLVFVPKNKKGSFIIPHGVTKIRREAFSACTSLTSIEIPNSVTKIGDSAFAGCKSLTSIKIPNSVTVIGEAAFSDCTSLSAVDIPESVIGIGEAAFLGCNISIIHLRKKIPIERSFYVIGIEKSKATLYVPKGSEYTYRDNMYYEHFKDIIGE